ncbi:MAG: cation diffusion facilitator family transporter [Ignisphaera sp.]
MYHVYASFIINIVTLILKIFGFIGTNSASLIADIINDCGDTIGLGLIIFGVMLANRKRSTIAYPFGMSRALYVIGLISTSIIGGFLFATSFINSIYAFTTHRTINSSLRSVTLVLIALILNSLNIIFISRTKKSFDIATTVTLLDGFADVGGNVIAFISIAIANPVIDSIGSFVITIIVLISSIAASYKYYLMLIGRAPPKEEMLKMVNATLSVSGVLDVNELRAVMLTEDEYLVILEVEVEEEIKIKDTETFSKQIETEIRRAVPKAKHIVIEFVPKRKEPPTYKKILEEIKGLR